jgi:hypothetical protein
MSATLTRPAWTAEFEIETIDKLIARHAPHFPTTRLQEPRTLTTPQEFENFYRFRIAGAAHDLYIVQVSSKVIDQIPDPELQLFLSRQIGDDGAHAQFTRQRVWELSGHDPIDKIEQEVQKHWDFIEFPPRDPVLKHGEGQERQLSGVRCPRNCHTISHILSHNISHFL